MKRHNPFEIVPVRDDDGETTYVVRDWITGRLLLCAASREEADEEIEAHFVEMDRFNDGPFSDAQSRR